MSVALRHLAAENHHEAVVWTLAGYERGQRFYEATAAPEMAGARPGTDAP